MRKILLFMIGVTFFSSCRDKKNIPDVSGIKTDITAERFDRSFFMMDSNDLRMGLHRLRLEHPGFYDDYMQEILGVSGRPDDPATVTLVHDFLEGYRLIYDSLKTQYNDLGWLREDLKKGFQFVKYYFPTYKTGKIILFVGPFDAPGVASTSEGLAIGLQQFAGSHFSVYQAPQMQEMFPLYISRRFSKEYMVANCMKAVVLELFPDQSGGKPLIEQMVEKGKQWWLLDKFLPYAPDSVKTGYTQQQLDWCTKNEGLIWSEIVRNEDLNSLSPTVIQTYIGEGPFTQGFPQESSPGNLGQWLGWQIVKKFVSKNSGLTPEEVMRTPARKILEEAKYKPK